MNKVLLQPFKLSISRILLVSLVAVFFRFSICSLTIIPAAAQTSLPQELNDIRMNAVPGFEGNFKYGEWIPIFVEIENNGRDSNAEIQVSIPGANGTIVYAALVELPSLAHKRVVLYVLPNNYSRELDVNLVSDDELLVSDRISVHPNPTVNYLVGLIAPERGALSMVAAAELPGIKRSRVMIDIPLDQIPERLEGLRSFDLLVLSDLDTTSLTPSQGIAIEAWVRQGGRLVIGGGAHAQLTTAGLPKSLFPGEISATEEILTVQSLEKFTGKSQPVLIPGPFVVAVLKSDTNRILISDGQIEFASEWKMGNGSVNFLALNPIVAPFDAWKGTSDFWSALISPGAAFSEYLPTDMSARQQFSSNMPYVLSNLPVLDMPSARGLALMLIVYILLIGPINYLVLRKRNQLQLAWITIPVITIIFSAASFTLGYILHGTDIFINKISVLQISPEGRAHFDSYVGIFSPAQTAYQIEVKGGGLLSPLNPYNEPWSSVSPSFDSKSAGRVMTLVQGDPALVKGLSVNQWSMQSFMSEGEIPNFGAITGDLQLVQDKITGSVTNSTSHSFLDSSLILGNKFVRIGPLEPGQKADVSLELAALGMPNFSASLSYAMFENEINAAGSSTRRQAEARRSIVESLFERAPPYIFSSNSTTSASFSAPTPTFIGWMDEAPPEVGIAGVEPGRQTSAVVVMPLSYDLADSGNVSIAVGMVPGSLVENPREGGTCGMAGTTSVYIARGEATFEFKVPPQFSDIEVENLKLSLLTDSGDFTSPKVELYNWDNSIWTALSGLNQGVSLIPEATKFLRTDGLIRVRLGAENAQSCYYLALGMDGFRP